MFCVVTLSNSLSRIAACSCLNMAVLRAIHNGDATALEEELGRMPKSPTVKLLRQGWARGWTVIMRAAATGKLDVFNIILTTMEATLTDEQLKVALTTKTYPGSVTLVLAAVEGGNNDIFNKAVHLLEGEVLKVTVRQHSFGRELLTDAARTGGLETFTSVQTILGTRLTEKEAIEMIEPQEENRLSILTTSVKRGNKHDLGAWAEVLAQKLSFRKMTQACSDSFSNCAQYLIKRREDPEEVPLRDILVRISILFAYGAVGYQTHLVSLANTFGDNLEGCFLGAMSLVDNPFVPGMTLSVALDDAVPKAREGQQVLTFLQNEVDELLLEVLERLPQSVETFPKGIHGCAEAFEPEMTHSRPVDFEGPLRLALKERQFTETFRAAPLVFDYLCHKFVMCLPDIRDSGNVIDKVRRSWGPDSLAAAKTGEPYLCTHKLVAGTNLGKFMQGIRPPSVYTGGCCLFCPWVWQTAIGGTILPGVQFAAIGILAEPSAYFKVPVMRMAMDFIVHLAFLGVYTNVILSGNTSAVNEDSSEDGSADEVDPEGPSKSEIFLAIYVTAALFNEMTQALTGVQEYCQDKWNWLDAFALGLLASGLYIRLNETDETRTSYGRAIYAMSAPLMFSRVLFFAQIFPRQGLVIQMIAIMIGEVAQFAVVVLVIMMGFTVGFLALFDEFDDSFGETWINVFNLMLGEVDAFEDNVFINNKFYGYVVRLMVVVYLIVMAVMLLNLLIAVLSTEHARVDEKKDREFSVSKVRLIKHYSSTVDKGSVPAPFNLIQIVIWLPFRALDLCFKRDTYGTAKRAVGVVAFWLITGPVTIVLAWSLWIFSTPYAMTRTWKGTTYNATSLAPGVLRCCSVVPLHLFVVPLVLVTLWLWSGVAGFVTATKATVAVARKGMLCSQCRQPDANDEYTSSHNKRDGIKSVAEILRDAPGGLGVAEIGPLLKDPDTNPSLLRDERRRPATVADLKRLLRTTAPDSSKIIEAKMTDLNKKLDDLFLKVQ